MPRVRGRSDSAAKYLMVSGLPSSRSWKSLLVKLGISPPFLSLTLKKSWTTLTLTFRVPTDWSRSSDWLSWFWLSGSGVPARWGSCWAKAGLAGKEAGDGHGGRQNGHCKCLQPADYRHPDILPRFLLVYSIRVRCTKLQVSASQILAAARSGGEVSRDCSVIGRTCEGPFGGSGGALPVFRDDGRPAAGAAEAGHSGCALSLAAFSQCAPDRPWSAGTSLRQSRRRPTSLRRRRTRLRPPVPRLRTTRFMRPGSLPCLR